MNKIFLDERHLQALSRCDIIDGRQSSFSAKIIHPDEKFRRRPNSFSLAAVLARERCKSNLNLRGINTRREARGKKDGKKVQLLLSEIIKRSGLILRDWGWIGEAPPTSFEEERFIQTELNESNFLIVWRYRLMHQGWDHGGRITRNRRGRVDLKRGTCLFVFSHEENAQFNLIKYRLAHTQHARKKFWAELKEAFHTAQCVALRNFTS